MSILAYVETNCGRKLANGRKETVMSKVCIRVKTIAAVFLSFTLCSYLCLASDQERKTTSVKSETGNEGIKSEDGPLMVGPKSDISNAVGQEAEKLSIREAVRMAIENRFELKAADYRVDQAQSTRGAALSERYPRLDFTNEVGMIRTLDDYEPIVAKGVIEGQAFELEAQRDVPDYRSRAGLQLTQSLYSGGRITHQIRMADEQVQEGEMAFEVEKRDISLGVIHACWDIKRAQELLKIAKEAVSLARTVFGASHSRAERGSIPRLERDRAMSELIKVELKEERAHLEKTTAVGRLMYLIGQSDRTGQASTISDSPDEHLTEIHEDLGTIVAEALRQRPEMLQMERAILSKEEKVKIVASDNLPSVDLKGEYQWIGYDGDRFADSLSDMHGDQWAVYFNLRYNLFEGGATRDRIRRARQERLEAEAELEAIRQAIIHEVGEAYFTLGQQRGMVVVARKNMVLAEQILNTIVQQFKLGAANVDKVAEYNTDLLEARQAYLNALINLQKTWADFRWATGAPLP
jgi:outer membrane protein TolC